MKVSNEKECKNLEKNVEEKSHQHKELLLEKCNLEEQVKSLEKNVKEMQNKINKREFEIREVMVKNMDLRTDLKRSKNKSNNETVLCRAELRETKRKLQDVEEALETVRDSEEKYKERLKELQAEYSESEQKLMDEIQTLQESNRQLKLMMEETQSDRDAGMSQLMTQLDEAKQMIGDKEEALEKMKRLEMEAQERIIEIEDVREKDKRLAQKEISNLMEKLDETKAELQRVKQSMSSETSTLQTELEEVHRKLEMCECTIRELREVEEQLRSKVRSLESLERHAKEDEEEINELKEQNESLHARLASQASENTTKLASLERSLHVIKVEKAELESELETMTEANERLQTQTYSLQTENERIRELQEKNTSLQTKLNSMKESNRKEVSDLEEILQQTRKARQDLEKEMDGLKNSEVRLNQRVARLEQDLDDREQMYKTQLSRLQDDNKTLHSRIQSSKGQSSSEVALLKLEIDTLHQEGQRSEQARQDMESEIENLRVSEAQLKREVFDLKAEKDEVVRKFEDEITCVKEENRDLKVACENVQGQSSSEVAILRSELKTLKRREEEKESSYEQLKASEQKLKKQLVEADMKKAKEDDRWQQTVSQLEVENKTLKDELNKEKAVGSVDSKELSDVKSQLVTLQGKYQSLEEKEMSLMKRLREAEGSLIKEKESHNKETRIFSMDIAKLKKEVESLTKENKSLISERCAIQAKASDLSEASREKEEMQNKARGLEEDLKQTDEERGKMERMLAEEREVAAKQEKTISDLQSTCSMLEEQVADLENLSDRLEQNLRESLEKSQKLEKELEGEKERSESMAKKMDKDLEAERMKLSALEAREADRKQKMDEEREAFKEAQRQQEEEREELNGDIQHWQEQSENYREQALKLAQQLAEMQTNGAKLEKDLRTLREKFAAERKDSDNLTSELASILDKFEETKATNYKLTTCLEKAIEKGEELKDAKSTLETEKDALHNQYSVEKIKLKGMMSQQTKLIDFLQAKVADPPKKKKRRLFGKSGKDKQTPESNMLFPMQYKELQEMLDYEMSKNAGLEKILEETRKELQAVKSATLKSQSSNSSSYLSLSSDISMSSALSDASTVLSAIVLSPTNQPSRDSLPTPVKGPFTRSKRKNIAQNTRASKRIKERMKHNIPHRFANILNMKPTKCAVCVDTVHFGRHASKCQECNLVCHPKCASALPHTCGLPFQFVRHFSEALHHQTDSPVTTFNSTTESSVLMRSQGWMKVRGSVELSWDKKWVTLDGPQLLLFDREHLKETSKPSKTFDLQPKEGWVSVHAGITPAELPNTVPSDIPFVIRLEHHIPSQSYFPAGDNVLYLMAPTFPEKQRWVAVLENVVALNGFGAAEVKRQTASIHSNTILSLENDNKLDINCTLVLDEELLLVGCDEGLFVMNLKKFSNPLAQLLGVGSLYQMKYIPQLVSVIIIAGELRKLGYVEAPHLIVQARDAPKKDTYIKCTSIASIEDCHLFAIEEINSSIYLCAAQPQKISILKYNYDSKQFVVKKELPTAETCSCLLFSQTGKLLAGMDRFYQVELSHYQADEFLDSNDPSLAHAINSTSDMNSFPVAALQVAAPDEREEFLLCFHEFALFVDANGHRTREEDLEWSRLPLSVTFREPYLFITHFNCLEVLEIKPYAQKDLPGAHTFVEMPIPRFVGFAISEGAIYVTSSNSQKVELVCVLGNLIDTISDEDNHDTTITMDTSEETPKTARTSGHVVRRSSRISLKRNLEDTTDSSNPKLSRTLSGASGRSNTSFRAAVASSGLRRSTRLAGTSSSEDEVNMLCGSLKMLSKGNGRSKVGK
ncbi:Citron Rho-interacting kinase [Holothuria leucospilota]|uniref:Citron Rho-interacting kinase n=1 Tax=Holothuria leucospilota TaxID=206669 RepID=A0A9Q1CEX2_HOLLE|nr:Citron Rho-interacting kinase [Holothuria leucospilota]